MRHNTKAADGNAVGPLIGLRRPRYELLHETLGLFLAELDPSEDLVVFVNLNSVLRHMFNEHAVAQLTRGELQRHPRVLAAELINIGGHYRHYALKHFGLKTTILFYYSSQRCQAKLDLFPDYKASMYAKRLGGATSEYDVVRRYVDFNLKVAKQVAERVPNLHVVDTGAVDPEAWPWALFAEGRVSGSAVFISSAVSDLQYALVDQGENFSARQVGILHASGEHTRMVRREGIFHEALRSSKTGGSLAETLDPRHFVHALALSGADEVGVPGLPKVGLSRAAKRVSDLHAKGFLPPDHAVLTSLLEEGKFGDDAAVVERNWKLLVHAHYAATLSSADMSKLDEQLVNRSGLAELERANAQFFSDAPLSLDMIFAGEGF